MKYRMVETGSALATHLRHMTEAGTTIMALDLEGEFNLHVYGERLCLIQIYDGTNLVAVDPERIGANDLRALFTEKSILKVMYDSLSDQALVQRCYGFGITSILDLRPAVELLNFEKKDLGSVLEASLGIRIEKKGKFQRYNWTRRPIDRAAIEYALSDVYHLLDLKEILLTRLEKAGLLGKFEEANASLQDRDFLSDRTPRIFKSGRFRKLAREAKSRFKVIYEIRDGHAKSLDVPPDTVMNKEQMFSLAGGSAAIREISLNRRMPQDIRRRLLEDLESALGR